MFLLEAPKIDSIPEAITKNTSRDSVKQRLDHLAGLTKLSFSTEQVDAGLGRPSFRDLTAFLFQPQNIVANPNVLFYKAETVEHRQKLRTIFPYVLGALDAETLARRHELQQIQRELRRKEQELENVRAISQRWLATTQARVAEARDLGLLEKDTPTPDAHTDRLVLLRQIVTVPRPDLTISSQTVAEGVDELNMLHSEEASVAQELSRLRRRFAEMEQLRATSAQVRDAVQIQRDRLHVSRWLKSNQTPDGRDCPVCGNRLTAPARELDLLVSSLEALEQTTSQFSSVPATFDRELQRVRSGIAEQTERLRGIRIRQSALTQQSEGAQRRQYSVLAASRFLGRLESELRTLDTIGQDGELSAEVESLRERVQILEKLISQAEVTARTRRALNTVNLNAGRIIPLLDAERPEDPISLSETELTIKV
jgi:DNA repair exonuclease SbcCD ATPase subunit